MIMPKDELEGYKTVLEDKNEIEIPRSLQWKIVVAYLEALARIAELEVLGIEAGRKLASIQKIGEEYIKELEGEGGQGGYQVKEFLRKTGIREEGK